MIQRFINSIPARTVGIIFATVFAAFLIAAPIVRAQNVANITTDPFVQESLRINQFEPGGRFFPTGLQVRGSVIPDTRTGSVTVAVTSSTLVGNTLIQQAIIGGQYGYTIGLSSHHPHTVHSPFDEVTNVTRTASDQNLTKQVTLRLDIHGRLIHPADGYDGPRGGGFPAPHPLGAIDHYVVSISGSAHGQYALTTNEVFRLNPNSDVPRTGNMNARPALRRVVGAEGRRHFEDAPPPVSTYRDYFLRRANPGTNRPSQELWREIDEAAERVSDRIDNVGNLYATGVALTDADVRGLATKGLSNFALDALKGKLDIFNKSVVGELLKGINAAARVIEIESHIIAAADKHYNDDGALAVGASVSEAIKSSLKWAVAAPAATTAALALGKLGMFGGAWGGVGGAILGTIIGPLLADKLIDQIWGNGLNDLIANTVADLLPPRPPSEFKAFNLPWSPELTIFAGE